MVREAFLGLDIGGTGVKAGVFDRDGVPLGAAHRPYSPVAHADGRVEIPIEVIEQASRAAIREAVAQSPLPVRAISVVSQGQTFVSLDGDGHPLHPAILWYDSRAADEAKELTARLALEPGPHPAVSAISTAPKIMWLRRHHPELMARARHHLLLPDYVTFRLLGRAVTDPQTAGSSGLTAAGAAAYHAGALAAAGLEASSLAEILPSGTAAGVISAEVAAEWGIPAGILVAAGTNDQYAGALGAGVCRPGLLSVATGTCLALVTLTRGEPRAYPPGLWSGHFPLPGYSFVLAYSKTAGVVLDWFQRQLAPGLTMKELDAEAVGVPAGSRGVTACPHFDGRISPAPEPGMRGLFSGLALHHTRADLYRALLESLAFSLRENIACLAAHQLPVEAIHAIGGAARSDLWLQMQADVTGLPVRRGRVTEAATLGGAMLAAKGADAFPSLELAVQGLFAPQRTFNPDPARRTPYEQAFARYVRLSGAAFHE